MDTSGGSDSSKFGRLTRLFSVVQHKGLLAQYSSHLVVRAPSVKIGYSIRKPRTSKKGGKRVLLGYPEERPDLEVPNDDSQQKRVLRFTCTASPVTGSPQPPQP